MRKYKWVSIGYKSLMVKLLSFVLMFFISQEVFAQPDYYYTVDGTIIINGIVRDSALTVRSDKVTVLINYDTGEFQMSFDASTLKTGVDSLDLLLEEQKGYVVQYEGKFGVDHVQTESHPPMVFNVEGYINCNYHNNFIHGTGRLEHLYDNHFSCILNLSFAITIDQLPFDIHIDGLSDEIQIEIVQMVLSQGMSGTHTGY